MFKSSNSFFWICPGFDSSHQDACTQLRWQKACAMAGWDPLKPAEGWKVVHCRLFVESFLVSKYME